MTKRMKKRIEVTTTDLRRPQVKSFTVYDSKAKIQGRFLILSNGAKIRLK